MSDRARRAAAVEPFLAVEMAERAQALERAGADVIHLEFGEPDFEAPAVVREALEKAVKDGRTKYTHSLGLPALREAIADHYAAAYGVRVSPDQVLVTPGTSPAMLLLFGLLLDPGDEAVLSDPHYACYPNFVRYAEGVPVTVRIHEAEGWALTADAVADRVGPRTRALLVNSPANPTGAVLRPEALAALAGLAERRGLWIVSDEIYHGLNYAGRDHSILEFTDRAFVLNGFSKAFAMTGWRLGYVVGPADRIAALQTLFGNFFISTNEFVQWAGVAALREAGDAVADFRQRFDQRRRVMVAGLRAIGFEVQTEPAGAFYVFAGAQRFSASSYEFGFELLREAHVAVTPGIDFGAGGEGYLRFSYASGLERIEAALDRLRRWLAGRATPGPGGGAR